jgi:hypothetical protein
MSMYTLIKKIDVLTESRRENPALAEAKNLIQQLEEAVVLEKNMTPEQKEKREEIVMSMKKDTAGLKERYGKRWKDVMYATATKQAMTEAAKPDFLDIDKDGDKSEPMKKAALDAKKSDESEDTDETVSESLNINISATDSDALPVIMKLAGMQTMMIAPDAEYAAEPETTSQGACMEAREDEIPFDNKPREKYSSIRDITKTGNDLNRPKTQHADKAKLGDNPLATALTEGLWKAYQDIKKKAD